MSTGSTCSTGGATSKRSKRARKPSSVRRRSTTARSADSRVAGALLWADGGQSKLGIAHPVGRVGEGSPASARMQVQHPLQVGAAVEPRSLDALAVALQDASADVGVERRRLDAK